MPADEILNAAIIGCGKHAHNHFDMIADEPRLRLEAIADFNETRHFVDCILTDTSPWSTLNDAVHTMRLCEAIYRGHKGPL